MNGLPIVVERAGGAIVDEIYPWLVRIQEMKVHIPWYRILLVPYAGSLIIEPVILGQGYNTFHFDDRHKDYQGTSLFEHSVAFGKKLIHLYTPSLEIEVVPSLESKMVRTEFVPLSFMNRPRL